MTEARFTRRRLLAGAGAALTGTAAVVAAVRATGYEVAPERAARLRAFDPWHLVVMEHVARRVAAPDRADGSVASPDEVDVALFADGLAARMRPTVRRDLLRMLAFVEHVAPLGAGFARRFTRLDPARQDRVLASIEAADEALLRGGFAGLKSLVFLGYYRDPRTWSILGYDGPLVMRPAGGWR